MTSVTLQEGIRIVRDRQKERASRMAQVLESFASGFTLRPVSLKLVNGGQAPAFSSSDRIWIHEGMLADLTTKHGVASIKGLTLHEIAHILLTPRSGSEFRQWVNDNRFNNAWNALEDQRIEALLVASYPSIRDWFEATMEQYLLKNRDQWSLAFPLVHGRKYLPADVRRVARAMYTKPQDTTELADIIDKFRALNMSDADDIETAKVLVERFHELTKNNRIENPHGHNHRSEGEHETNAKSKPWDKNKQKSASDKVKDEPEDEDTSDLDEDLEDYENGYDYPDESDDEDEYEGDSNGDGDDSGDESEDESEDASGDDHTNGTPSGLKPTDGDESDEDGNGDSTENNESDTKSSDLPDDGNEATGAGDSDNALGDLLEDLIKQGLDEAMERLEDKIATDIDLYNGETLLQGEQLPEPKMSEYEERTVSKEAVQAQEQFAYELQRIRAEYEPSWNNRVDSGRVNPVRWERGCEIEEAFDRFEEGREDATDIECVILLDVSYSMKNEIVEAYESMWAMKSALDGVNASTTVVLYSDGEATRTLYSSYDRAGNSMRFGGCAGGTNPLKALQYAHGVLANTSRAVKLLITITDGEWQDDTLEKCDNLIQELRDGGVLTSLAWLSPYRVDLAQKNTHNAEIVSQVRSTSDLFHLGRSIVEVGILRQLTH